MKRRLQIAVACGLLLLLVYLVQAQVLGLVCCIRAGDVPAFEISGLDDKCQCASSHSSDRTPGTAWSFNLIKSGCRDISINSSLSILGSDIPPPPAQACPIQLPDCPPMIRPSGETFEAETATPPPGGSATLFPQRC